MARTLLVTVTWVLMVTLVLLEPTAKGEGRQCEARILVKPEAEGEGRQCEAKVLVKPEAKGDSQKGETRDAVKPEAKGEDQKGEARVLILHPIYAGSHELTLRKLGEELISRGHQVTQVRWRSSKTRQVSTPIQVITLSPNNSDLRYPYMHRDGTFHPPTAMLWERPRRLWQVPTDVFSLMDAHCLSLLGDAALLTHLRRANFTVALVDLIANECSLALAHLLGLPVVAFWGFSFQGGEARAMGVFQSPAVVPTLMSEVGADMSFRERVWNTLMTLAECALIAYHLSNTDYYIQRLAPRVPKSRQLLTEVEAVLVHSHWLLDYAKLMPPHVQYVGCIQCGPPAPLPHPLHAWMTGAGAGVILFSLGYTGYEASAVPGEVMTAFLGAFSRLQQRVLLRFNAALIPRTPDNVMVLDWVPQHDILGHPKTVLFVSHCGQNGINEAVYHGVPLVAVPVFADQGDNARRIVDRGLGVVVDKTEITEEGVHSAITTVLLDAKYRQTARRFSRLWQEEEEAKESGVEVAVRWIEKVHRHGRLTHLRLPGAHLSFHQYFVLDVAALLVVVISISLCLVYHCLCRCCYKRGSTLRPFASPVTISKLRVN